MKHRPCQDSSVDVSYDRPMEENALAAMWPIHTASRHKATDPKTFAPTASQRPCCARTSVCKLKAENVVKPPRNPTTTKRRVAGDTARLPVGASHAETKPTTKQPVTLTVIVAQGNVSPWRCTIQSEHQWRTRLPSAPPSMTASASFTVLEW